MIRMNEMALNRKQQTRYRVTPVKYNNLSLNQSLVLKLQSLRAALRAFFFKLHFHHTLSFFKNTRPHTYTYTSNKCFIVHPLNSSSLKFLFKNFFFISTLRKKEKTLFFFYDVKVIINLRRDLNAQKYFIFFEHDETPRPGILKTT